MTNKNILIIGSSGGIGKAFVDIFAKQNANNKIIGLSRSENKDSVSTPSFEAISPSLHLCPVL